VEILRYLIEIPLLLYALFRGTQEAREILADRIGKLKKRKYRVKSTVIKDIIREDHTECIKLRQLRVYNDTQMLSIDSAPYVVETGAQIKTSNLYSIPGRADISPTRKIDIRFLEDEKLKPFRDHSVVLGYTLNATLEEQYEPPGVLAKQPVGKDCLVYEAHFPKGRYYERAGANSDKPKMRVYTTEVKEPLDPRKYNVEGNRFDFGDGLGDVDWLRITIPNPPQDNDINIEWFWEKGDTRR